MIFRSDVNLWFCCPKKTFFNTVRHHSTSIIYPFSVSSSHTCIVIQDFYSFICYTL